MSAAIDLELLMKMVTESFGDRKITQRSIELSVTRRGRPKMAVAYIMYAAKSYFLSITKLFKIEGQ